jgi:hypothetical protein
MELKIDLIPKRKRSNFTILLGSIGVALSIIYFIIIMHGNNEKLTSQWPIMLYMFVYGINGIIVGLGYSVEKFFGSAYVHIDDEHIAIKPGVRTKEQSIFWSQIKSLEYKANWFKIIHSDGSSSKFSLSDLEFKVLIEARDAIRMMAAEKGITIN